MRNGSFEQQTVNQVVTNMPEAARTLREYRIDATSRMSLATAAAATSSNVDEILAVMDARMRRAARRAAARPIVEEIEEHDLFV